MAQTSAHAQRRAGRYHHSRSNSGEHAVLPADRIPGLPELPLGGSACELPAEHCDTEPQPAI